AAGRANETGLEGTGLTCRAQLGHPVRIGEDRKLRDQDLGCLAKRRRRVDRAVGLDVEGQLVEVGLLTDASLLDVVSDASHRREDRVDRDYADRLIRRLVLLGGAV